MKNLILLFLLFASGTLFAQDHLTYSPQKPKSGEVVTLTYLPTADIIASKKPIEVTIYKFGNNGISSDELILKKGKDNYYTASFESDTATSFAFFKIAADKIQDNNDGNGYWIQFYNGEQLQKGANLGLARLNQSWSGAIGIDRNNDKALEAFDEEFKLYPESRNENLLEYLRTLTSIKKEEAPEIFQKEIEALINQGLKEEKDYTLLMSLYNLAKLPKQASFIANVIKDKYPNGRLVAGEQINAFMAEKDIAKKTTMLNTILTKVETDSIWKSFKSSVPQFKQNLASAYSTKGDWAGMEKVVSEYGMEGAELASFYNSLAWNLQLKDKDLDQAEKMSAYATQWTRNDWQSALGKKGADKPSIGEIKGKANLYSMFADTYAMVNYKLKNYKKGFPYADEAALKIQGGKDPDQNGTYALLAEKQISPKKYMPILENIIKEGNSNEFVKEVFERTYLTNHSQQEFDTYYDKLEKYVYYKMIDELKKSMTNLSSPQFTLKDLNGQNVSLSDLKNKIVIVDFWATWCGPCKASFPAMQKMVTKYKDNPNVKFIFIDTWENIDNKEKAVGEFIASNKYDFHVLMDMDSKVVESFKVDGIPTKFVLDKQGNIRFKSVGWSGSDDKLISELTAMIELVEKAG